MPTTLYPRLMHELRGVGADIAEALHNHATALARHAEFLDSLVADNHNSAAGGFAASARSADVDGLAGNARRHRLPHVHGVGIHHPRHDLFVGIDVRGRNIFFWSDEFNQFGSIAPRHALDFAHRHLVGIANYAALRPAERDVDYGALPGHPTGQGAHFIERDIRRVADAAFCRAARNGVLDTKSGKHLQVPVIHLDRDVNREFTVGITQNPPQSVVEIEFLGGQIEARPLRFPRIAFFVDLRRQ